ncbi:hypothetical protein LINGRAHAP2_LOCUS5219 [Linum grandiflorum]
MRTLHFSVIHMTMPHIRVFLNASFVWFPRLFVSGASCGIVEIVFSISSGWTNPSPV